MSIIVKFFEEDKFIENVIIDDTKDGCLYYGNYLSLVSKYLKNECLGDSIKISKDKDVNKDGDLKIDIKNKVVSNLLITTIPLKEAILNPMTSYNGFYFSTYNNEEFYIREYKEIEYAQKMLNVNCNFNLFDKEKLTYEEFFELANYIDQGSKNTYAITVNKEIAVVYL